MRTLLFAFLLLAIIMFTAFSISAEEQQLEEETLLTAAPTTTTKKKKEKQKAPDPISAECSDMPKLLQSDRFSNVEQRRLEGKLWKNDKAEDFRHPDYPDTPLESPFPGQCNVPRVPLYEMTMERFDTEFRDKMPVVIQMPRNRSQLFADVTQKDVLLHCFGDQEVVLSTANAVSTRKTFGKTLAEYIGIYVKPQDFSASGLETLYMFGDQYQAWWNSVFQWYKHPARLFAKRLEREPALSFGIAATGTGVPLHTHGGVYAEMLHGYKRWFFAPPGVAPHYDGDESVLKWMLEVLPTYSEAERSPPKLYDCTIEPGEVLWIPANWHHSTFNIGEAVFISSFL